MEWQRRFYEWFLAQLLATLEGRGQRVEESTTVAPRSTGQHVRGPGRRVRFTRRQSNLAPRPGQTLVSLPGQQLGDGSRARIPFEPQPAPTGVPARRYPWAAPYPVAPPVQRTATVEEPAERFAGAAVPTLTYAWDEADAWFKFLGDPHACYPFRYSGNSLIQSQAQVDMTSTDPRMRGPNFFLPYGAERITDEVATFGMEVPAFAAFPYYRNDPNAFTGGVQTFAPSGDDRPVTYLLALALWNAHRAGHDYAISYFQPGPLEQDGDGAWVHDPDFGWPISLTRPAVFTAFSASADRIAWPVVRYTTGGQTEPFTSEIFRYAFNASPSLDGHTRDVDYALFDNGGPGQDVPDTWSHIWCIGTGAPPLSPGADSRPYTPGVWHRRNFMDPDDTNVPSWWIAQGTIGVDADDQAVGTTMKAIVDVRYRYNVASRTLFLEAKVGYAAYAPTVWTMGNALTQNGTWDGRGYSIGGQTRGLDEPAFIGPEAQAYDTSHGSYEDATLSSRWVNKLMRLTTIGNTETPEGIRLWWSQSRDDMETRAPASWPDASRDLGIEHDWLNTDLTLMERTYNDQDAPTVPTVGRFAWNDFGPTALLDGEGQPTGELRMSHQESFDDLNWDAEEETGDAWIIGRILSLYPTSLMKCYFPPTDPEPHGYFWWPLDTVDSSASDDFATAVANMLESTLGDVPMPYSGETPTFAGMTVDGSSVFAADALVDGQGREIAVVLAEDYSARITIDADTDTMWTGTLEALLGPTAFAAVTAAGSPAPVPHQRFLHPSWPTRTLVLHVGSLHLVFRARTRGDVVGPRGAPLAFSHFGEASGD